MKVSSQFHVPTSFPLGKTPRYPLYRELCGLRAGMGVMDKRKISCPYRVEPRLPGHPARTLVSIPTELSLFLITYYGRYIKLITSCSLNVMDSPNFPRDTGVNVTLVARPSVASCAGALRRRERGLFASKICIRSRILPRTEAFCNGYPDNKVPNTTVIMLQPCVILLWFRMQFKLYTLQI
jgi:hypothetical protein